MDVLVGNALPEALAALRAQAEISRRRLSELSGVSDGTIKAIERGESEKPHPETLRLLARGLAANRLTGRVDAEQAEALYGHLMIAGGYGWQAAAAPSGDELPDDLRANLLALYGTDEELTRAVLADLGRRNPEGRRSALRFIAEALAFGNGAQRRPGRH